MENLENCQTIIDACVSFKNSVERFDENEKLSKKIVSVLGEFYVLRELLSNGFPNAKHKGGQSKYDLEITNPLIRIEVKTSTLKRDARIFRGEIDIWGWTVETRNQWDKWTVRSDTRFDYLIAVALDKTWKKPKFYVFAYNETVQNPALVYPEEKSPIYPSIFKRIQAFNSSEDYKNACIIEKNVGNKWDFISSLDRAIFEREDEYKNNWKKIVPIIV